MVLHHPDRDELERYARGETPAGRSRWIEDHLRSHCPSCQRLVDELLPGDPPASAPTSPPRRELRPASRLVVANQAAPPLEPSDAWDRIFARLDQRLNAIAAERRAAPQLLDELLRQPSDRWVASIRDNPRFTNLCLCDLIVERTAADAAAPLFVAPPLRPAAPVGGPATLTGGLINLANIGTVGGLLDIASLGNFAASASNVATIPGGSGGAAGGASLDHPALPAQPAGSAASVADTTPAAAHPFPAPAGGGALPGEGVAAPELAAVVEMAELGILIADHLDANEYGAAMVNDMRARSWAALAAARRATGDLAGAERALDLAESLAEEGSADPLEEAKLLELRAALLADQGWYEEAADLVDSMIEIYDDVKDLHRMGRALIKKGLYLGFAGRPHEAVELLPAGLALLDPGLDPESALLARHHLAWFHNERGDWRRAEAQLGEFRHLYATSRDSRSNLRLDWLEARIAHRSRRFDEAEWRLRHLRQHLVETGAGLDASMVVFDLARLYLDQGKPSKLRRLSEELQPLFLSRDLHQDAAAALSLFQQAIAGDRLTVTLLRQLATSLCRGPRDASLLLSARGRIA